MRGYRLIGLTDYPDDRRSIAESRLANVVRWLSGRDDSSCHSSVAVLLKHRAEVGQTGSLACLLTELLTSVVQLCTYLARLFLICEITVQDVNIASMDSYWES